MRKLRIILAAVFFIGITLLFVGIGQQWWGWMAKLNFLPSCFALNFAVLAGVLILTLLLGRLYCSVICPLGILQDLLLKLNKKKKFSYSPERKWLRFIVFAVVVVSVFAVGQVLIALVAPYSAYGRMVSAICNAFVGSTSLALALTAGISFVVIALSAVFWGRLWCNTICPVGTLLSLVSRFSIFRPEIDDDKCIGCGKCARKCKSACIDPVSHKIDMSRCVVCFDCLDNCTVGAISYKAAKPTCSSKCKTVKKDNCESKLAEKSCAEISEDKAGEKSSTDEVRRNFIATGAVVLGSGLLAKAQDVEKHLDGGLAQIEKKQAPSRSERVVPPGAESVKNFYDHCTACQLCVQNCPNDVLRPSTDLEHFLQPQMGFEKGYCRPECTVCSELCPAGAILPLKQEEKLSVKIGTASVDLELCFAANEEATCGNCSRHCPSGAIRMVRSQGYRFAIPVVMEEQCIGCGACEHLCPSRPISAITVNGLSSHIRK